MRSGGKESRVVWTQSDIRLPPKFAHERSRDLVFEEGAKAARLLHNAHGAGFPRLRDQEILPSRIAGDEN